MEPDLDSETLGAPEAYAPDTALLVDVLATIARHRRPRYWTAEEVIGLALTLDLDPGAVWTDSTTGALHLRARWSPTSKVGLIAATVHGHHVIRRRSGSDGWFGDRLLVVPGTGGAR